MPPSARKPLGGASLLFDYDNDGHQDLYVCNQDAPNRLYRHEGAWPCVDMAEAMGVAVTGLSYGVASGDIDDDGDLDLLVQTEDELVRLFVNHACEAAHWLKVRLIGDAPNRFAIGAAVRVRTGGVWRVRQVLAGTNFKSQNELTLHFGLAGATTADEIVVRWPGGLTRTLPGGDVDQTLTICQTEPPAVAAPSPAHGAAGAGLSTSLMWSGAAQAGFSLHFGVSDPPPPVGITNAPIWSPGTLQPDQTYFWRVDTVTTGCSTIVGPVWSFTTQSGVPAVDTLSIRIVAPAWFGALSTTAATLDLVGVSHDETGVTTVTWSSDRGAAGPATTSNGWAVWTAAGIPLQEGLNVITATATDSDGHVAADQLVVTRQLPPLTVDLPVDVVVAISSPTSSPTYTTIDEWVDLAGSATGDVISVGWADERGGSGPCQGTTAWTRPRLLLAPGISVITVTASAADGRTSSAVLAVTFQDAIAPFVRITAPSDAERFVTAAPVIALSGSASDNVGVTHVRWMSAAGAGSPANGTTEWLATDIVLADGENQITVTAFDAAGNSTADTLTLLRVAESQLPPAAAPAPHDDAVRATDSADSEPQPADSSNGRLRAVRPSPCGVGLAAYAAATLALASVGRRSRPYELRP